MLQSPLLLPSPLSPTWQGDSGLQKYCIHMTRLEAWGRKSVFLESLSSEKILPFYFYSFHVGLLSPFKIISWYVSTFICLPTFRFSLLFRREMISLSPIFCDLAAAFSGISVLSLTGPPPLGAFSRALCFFLALLCRRECIAVT